MQALLSVHSVRDTRVKPVNSHSSPSPSLFFIFCFGCDRVAVIGRRKGFEKYHGEFPPSNIPLAAIGAVRISVLVHEHGVLTVLCVSVSVCVAVCLCTYDQAMLWLGWFGFNAGTYPLRLFIFLHKFLIFCFRLLLGSALSSGGVVRLQSALRSAAPSLHWYPLSSRLCLRCIVVSFSTDRSSSTSDKSLSCLSRCGLSSPGSVTSPIASP